MATKQKSQSLMESMTPEEWEHYFNEYLKGLDQWEEPDLIPCIKNQH